MHDHRRSSRFPIAALALLLAGQLPPTAQAAAVPVFGTGATPAELLPSINEFRAFLGGANNGVGGSFPDGRREINWDGVPDAFAAPNFLPANFFNANSARGAVFSTVVEEGGTAFNSFLVSADSTTTGGTPLRFGDIDPSYQSTFSTFSSERLFSVRNGRVMEVTFFVPGTNTPATVSGFGVVFSDVDAAAVGERPALRCVDGAGDIVGAATARTLDNGLSFVGLAFDAGERCARVIIVQGGASLLPGNVDGPGVDVVAMDDFIYGEPQPIFASP